MEYEDVTMFMDEMHAIQATEQIQLYNVLRLANSDPKNDKVRRQLRKLERASNDGKLPVEKTTLEQRVALMRGLGVTVEQ